MDSDCLELRCPLTDCRVKLRGFATSAVVRLHRHLVQDHKVLELGQQCPICKEVYSSKWYTPTHVKAVHLQPRRTIYPSEIQYKEFYKCKQCGAKLTQKANMLRHIQSHAKMMYASTKRNSTADASTNFVNKSNILKVISEGRRMSMHKYSIFDILGPKNSGYRIVPGLNNRISIQMTPKAATTSPIEISDVFFTNENNEVISVNDATGEDVIDIIDSEDDVSVSEASESGEDTVVIMDNENDSAGSEDGKKCEDRNMKENSVRYEHRGMSDPKQDLDSNDDKEFNAHLDMNNDLDSNDDKESNEEQDDVVAEIEQYMQEEDLLEELEKEISTKS